MINGDFIEVRCPNCGKLLFKATGIGTKIEFQCPRNRCHMMLYWPSDELIIATPYAEEAERVLNSQV